MGEIFLSDTFFSLGHRELYNNRDFVEMLRQICGAYIRSYDVLLISCLSFVFISYFLSYTILSYFFSALSPLWYKSV